MAVLPPKKRRELGDFLRAHRARLSPASLGLPRHRPPPHARASGAKEVAQACGMSPTWYTWLEQGRDIAASPPALSALARALQLTPAERAYLFELADRRDPNLSGRAGEEGMDVPPAPGARHRGDRRSRLSARSRCGTPGPGTGRRRLCSSVGSTAPAIATCCATSS